MTGLRRHEVLKLSMDAKSADDPGFTDSRCLYFPRSDTHKGVAQFCRLHPALRVGIRAHHAWHQMRFSESPWWFPSPIAPESCVDIGALSHGLVRACKLLKLPRRTTHGLRSYYVNVLRSQKVSDAEIALRIGQKTAGKLIVDVYGEFRNQTLTWIPRQGPAAWARWLTSEKSKVLRFVA
jgi:integrase